LGAVRLPARDIGPPYLARFSGVSGTGALATTWVPTAAEVFAADDVAAGAAGAEVVSAGGAADVSVEVVSGVAGGVVDWADGMGSVELAGGMSAA
jgi:hypothetical protein